MQYNCSIVSILAFPLLLYNTKYIYEAFFQGQPKNSSFVSVAESTTILTCRAARSSENSWDCRLCCSGIRFYGALGISHEHDKNTWEETPLAQIVNKDANIHKSKAMKRKHKQTLIVSTLNNQNINV